MKKYARYILAFMLLVIFLSYVFVKSKSITSNNPNINELAEAEIYKVVTNNLDEMDKEVNDLFIEPWGYETAKLIYNQDNKPKIIDEAIINLKTVFKNLVSKNFIDTWTIDYLYDYHVSFHAEYLQSTDIHTRFIINEQRESYFKVSFLMLDFSFVNSLKPVGTIYLDYIYEDGRWVLDNYELVDSSKKPFNLSFDDLKEYYTKFYGINSGFKPIEEFIHGENTYLIYYFPTQDSKYRVRNRKDSIYTSEIIDLYNLSINDKNSLEDENIKKLEDYNIYEVDYARIIMMTGQPRVTPFNPEVYVRKLSAGSPIFRIKNSPVYPQNVTILRSIGNDFSNHDIYSLAYYAHGDGHITWYPQPTNFEMDIEAQSDDDFYKLGQRILDNAKVVYVKPFTPEEVIEFIESVEFIYD